MTEIQKPSETRYKGSGYDFPGVFIIDGIPVATIQCRSCSHREPRSWPRQKDNGCNRCGDFRSVVDPIAEPSS